MARSSKFYRPLEANGQPVNNEHRRVRLFGRVWDIYFVEGRLLSNGKLCDGLCDSEEQEIHVTGATSRDWQRCTLIHEVRHAIDMTHNRGFADDDEASVRASELGWYYLLREARNDWMIEFIREGRDD